MTVKQIFRSNLCSEIYLKFYRNHLSCFAFKIPFNTYVDYNIYKVGFGLSIGYWEFADFLHFSLLIKTFFLKFFNFICSNFLLKYYLQVRMFSMHPFFLAYKSTSLYNSTVLGAPLKLFLLISLLVNSLSENKSLTNIFCLKKYKCK